MHRRGAACIDRPLAALLLLASLAVGCGSQAPVGVGPGADVERALARLATTGGPGPQEPFDALSPPVAGPDPAWADLLGHYSWEGPDGTVEMVLHERAGRPFLAIGGALLGARWEGEGRLGLEGAAPLTEARVARDPAGRVAALVVAGARFERLEVGPGVGETFRIDPLRPVAELRAEALEASPPAQPDGLLDSDLVELAELTPGIQLEIRYATTNNFMGAAFYTEPRAFLQRPAAEALARAHQSLAEYGYGLKVFDAYRPWYVTRMFWDATPEHQRDFVADPAQGSRHNRGCAVDLTLFDLATGAEVAMTGGYDEFTERSYAAYVGGTSLQRWHRELLRAAMVAQGFAVYEYEWWHFDFQEWEKYPVLDLTFDRLASH